MFISSGNWYWGSAIYYLCEVPFTIYVKCHLLFMWSAIYYLCKQMALALVSLVTWLSFSEPDETDIAVNGWRPIENSGDTMQGTQKWMAKGFCCKKFTTVKPCNGVCYSMIMHRPKTDMSLPGVFDNLFQKSVQLYILFDCCIVFQNTITNRFPLFKERQAINYWVRSTLLEMSSFWRNFRQWPVEPGNLFFCNCWFLVVYWWCYDCCRVNASSLVYYPTPPPNTRFMSVLCMISLYK